MLSWVEHEKSFITSSPGDEQDSASEAHSPSENTSTDASHETGNCRHQARDAYPCIYRFPLTSNPSYHDPTRHKGRDVHYNEILQKVKISLKWGTKSVKIQVAVTSQSNF